MLNNNIGGFCTIIYVLIIDYLQLLFIVIDCGLL